MARETISECNKTQGKSLRELLGRELQRFPSLARALDDDDARRANGQCVQAPQVPSRTEPLCCKCGHSLSSAEPWCFYCARDHAAEYAVVYRAWAHEHGYNLLKRVGVPVAYQSCTLGNYVTRIPEHQRARAAVSAWAVAPAPTSLYLFGPPGSGKTHLATAALLEMLARRRYGRFVSSGELLLECRESYRTSNRRLSEILDDCSERDTLLLDDLCAEKSTEFAREVFLQIVARAYDRRRPQLIVTSNLDLVAVGRRLDERIADRLRELCEVLKIGGPSHRRHIANDRARGRGTEISGDLR